jgi:WD40 repeat protein
MKNYFTIIFMSLSLSVSAQLHESRVFRNLSQINAACYNTEMDLLATATKDTIHLWKNDKKTILYFWKAHEKAKINDLVFAKDSNWLISAASDKSIKIWTLTKFSEYKTLTGHIGSVTALALSPDGKMLASVSEDVSLRIWNLKNFQLVRVFYGHKGKLSAVAFSPDGRYVASAGEDKQLIVQEVKTGNIVRKIAFPHLKWIRSIAFSPDSKTIALCGDYYLISLVSGFTGNENIIKDIIATSGENTVSKISFLAGGDVLAVATSENNVKFITMTNHEFINTINYRSNKLTGFAINESESEILAFSGSRASNRLSELKLPASSSPNALSVPKSPIRQQLNNKADYTPPQILIISPKINSGNKLNLNTETVTIKGQILDDYGIFKVLLNGQEILLSPEGIFEVELKMVFGENMIALEALDASGNTSLKKISINRTQNNGSDVEFDMATAKNYLFIIGIDRYKYWRPLSNATSDSQDLMYILNNQYTFDESLTTVLNNEEASRKNIYEKFKELIGKIRGNDNLLIYFSGHGHYDAGLKEGYWIPVDAQQNNDSDYIPNSYLLSLIRRMEARHIFVVADACFSGALFAESNRGYIDNVEQLKSRWALTSGRLEYVSDGNAGQHSPFAKVLIAFLKDTKKQRFPVSELVQYVKVETANTSSQTPIGNPLKSIGDEGGEFIFYKRTK